MGVSVPYSAQLQANEAFGCWSHSKTKPKGLPGGPVVKHEGKTGRRLENNTQAVEKQESLVFKPVSTRSFPFTPG